MKTIKIEFTKGLAGLGYGYTAGQISDVPEKMAIDFIDNGWARIVSSSFSGGTKKTAEKKEGSNITATLPASVPYRELLIEKGLDRIAKVKAHKDLATIKGIGEKSKESILKSLK